MVFRIMNPCFAICGWAQLHVRSFGLSLNAPHPALLLQVEAVQRAAADAASRHALEMATLRDQVGGPVRRTAFNVRRTAGWRKDPVKRHRYNSWRIVFGTHGCGRMREHFGLSTAKPVERLCSGATRELGKRGCGDCQKGRAGRGQGGTAGRD